MANTMRWRYGETNPVVLPAAAAVDVEIGDLVYLDRTTGTARPSSALTDQGSSVLNQFTFQDNFIGVAMQASPVGKGETIRIATSGVFELDCDSSAWALGDAAGAAVNLAGTQLIDQKVAKTTSLGGAIGRCAKHSATATTRVLVDIVSVVLRGGPQAPA